MLAVLLLHANEPTNGEAEIEERIKGKMSERGKRENERGRGGEMNVPEHKGTRRHHCAYSSPTNM